MNCVGLALGIAILTCSERGPAVIDASTDFRRVTLPADWRAQCIDESGRLRQGLEPVKRQACVTIAGNNRLLRNRQDGALGSKARDR